MEPPDERLAAVQKENPDTVAWITIPGTNIDAPVQQYGDNDYYLRRDEKGAKDYHGCIYADYACRMDSGIKVSRNLIFYGHTFTDEDYVGGFEDLHKYRVFEFGQENPYIYVSLADEKLTYQIFSVWSATQRLTPTAFRQTRTMPHSSRFWIRLLPVVRSTTGGRDD